MSTTQIVETAFEAIYSEDRWHGGSGPGSLPSSTISYRLFVEEFLLNNNIQSVTDLGSGDWQFSRFINWGSAKYTGLDVVRSLVHRNNDIYGTDNISFEISKGLSTLPGGDLLLCKEVLQHLPNDLIAHYLLEIREKYKFAIITNSVAPGSDINSDIAVGGYRPLRVDLPPFNAPGANVLSYYPYNPKNGQMWRNSVFLMMGSNV